MAQLNILLQAVSAARLRNYLVMYTVCALRQCHPWCLTQRQANAPFPKEVFD